MRMACGSSARARSPGLLPPTCDLTTVTDSLPCVPGIVGVTGMLKRLRKTTSMDSRRLNGKADTDFGLAKVRCAARALFCQRRQITENTDRAMERLDGLTQQHRVDRGIDPRPRSKAVDRFLVGSIPWENPLSEGSQPAHFGRVPRLVVCGKTNGLRISPVHS